MKLFSFLLFLFIFVSCSPKKKEVIENKTGVELISLGQTNFGGVIVGDFKDSAIKIINHGPNQVSTDIVLTPPFSIVSKSSECYNGILNSSKECIVSVRFSPQIANLTFINQDFIISDKKITLSGRGVVGGYLDIDSDTWNIGSVIAGSVKTKSFNLTNLGDYSIQTPSFNAPNYIKIKRNLCGSFIGSRKTCLIELEATPLVSGTFNFDINLVGSDSSNKKINFQSSVSPSTPYGIINFLDKPSSLGVGNNNFLVQSDYIRDQYGNIVLYGTQVFVSVNNLLSSVDGTSFLTQGGKISFNIQTKTEKGIAGISISSSESSGYYSFPVTSGMASGTLSFKNKPSEIIANGVAQTILTTNAIVDVYGNIVEDNTPVFFELVGDGRISSSGDPKKFTALTLNGQASMTLRSGTTAQNAQILITSGDLGNNIYNANGNESIVFSPGSPSGTISINSNFSELYAGDIIPDGVDLSNIVSISIGPVKDLYNNIVKPNTDVTISATNGLIIASGDPNSSKTIKTDTNGMVYFNLKGNGIRGNILLNVQSGFATGSKNIWAVLKSKVSEGNLSYSIRHHSAHDLPEINHWGKIYGREKIASLDGTFYGREKENDNPKTLFSPNEGLPFFEMDCFDSAKEFLVMSFCKMKDDFYSPFLKYSPSHFIEEDILSNNTNQELLSNGQFLQVNGFANWERVPVDATNFVNWDIYLGGSLYINNEIPVDGQKRYALSEWIVIDDTKIYGINALLINKGPTTASNGAIGIIEGDELYTDPAYTYPDPIILKDDIDSTKLNIQQRVIYRPTSGTKAIKVYLSTKESGQGVYNYWDNISFKLLDNFNFHDSLVNEGTSVAYLDFLDSLILVGGSTLVEESGPTYYGYTSDSISKLDKILSPSQGIEPISMNVGNYGSLPPSRTQSAITKNSSNVYVFGGYDNSSSEGSAGNDIFKFNGNTRMWSQINDVGDLLVLNNFEGKPEPRYLTGMQYQSELNSIFIFGGLVQDTNDNSIWTQKDDLWKINLNNNTWTRICESCSLFYPNALTPISNVQIPLENFPEIQSRYVDYKNVLKNLKRPKLIWHDATQMMLSFIPESNYMKKINVFNNTIENLSGSLGAFGNMHQVIYNDYIGRTFGYLRQDENLNNSKIYYWDMDSDEKQYIKIEVSLTTGAKDYIKKLILKSYSFGSTKTKRVPEIKTNGTEIYIYNYLNNSWSPLAGNDALTVNDAQGNPIDVILNVENMTDFVNNDNKISLLLTTKGRPGFDGGDSFMGDSLNFVDHGMNISKMSNGKDFSCILDNSNAKCWGRNDFGQLGQGVSYLSFGESTGEVISLLPNINIGDSFKDLIAGYYHACAITGSDNLKCWGRNDFGQLGYETNLNKGNSAITMGSNLNNINLGGGEVVQVSIGEFHTCALIKVSSTGTKNKVKCWGRNDFGQLGYGDNLNRGSSIGDMSSLNYVDCGQIFDAVLGNRDISVEQISSGANHVCALLEDNSVKCWGRNDFGQLGQGNTLTTYNSPTTVNLSSFVVSKIMSGENHNCILENNNSVKCWGRNDFGQLASGDLNNKGDNPNEMGSFLTDVNLGSESIVDFSIGANHACAVLSSNNIKCWGDNRGGQGGYGPNVDFIGQSLLSMGDNLSYVDLGNTLFNNVFAGKDHTCASINNEIKCWGSNGFGQLGYEDSKVRGRGLALTSGTNSLYLDFLDLEVVY